jgi:site-specific DNA-cytosine methylase
VRIGSLFSGIGGLEMGLERAGLGEAVRALQLKKTKHNPERKSWKGKSYKKGGKRIRDEREKMIRQEISE